jgi:hypothetical protein
MVDGKADMERNDSGGPALAFQEPIDPAAINASFWRKGQDTRATMHPFFAHDQRQGPACIRTAKDWTVRSIPILCETDVLYEGEGATEDSADPVKFEWNYGVCNDVREDWFSSSNSSRERRR